MQLELLPFLLFLFFPVNILRSECKSGSRIFRHSTVDAGRRLLVSYPQFPLSLETYDLFFSCVRSSQGEFQHVKQTDRG